MAVLYTVGSLAKSAPEPSDLRMEDITPPGTLEPRNTIAPAPSPNKMRAPIPASQITLDMVSVPITSTLLTDSVAIALAAILKA